MEQENRPLVNGAYLEYLDKPLVRQGDTICYGDMNEKYILTLDILSYDEKGLPDDIFVTVVESQNQTKVFKSAPKKGLSDAFSIGLIWLERALKAESKAD